MKFKRLLVAGLLLIIPLVVQAQFTCTTNSGKVTITKYTGSGGAVTVPGQIGGFPVIAIANYGFSNCSNVTSVTINDSVTSIGTFAFRNCTNLTSVILPANITGLGLATFQFCTNLINVAIPSGVTSIGNFAFEGCGITNLIIPGGVTNIGMSAFYDCAGLAGVYFQGTAPLSVGGSVFSGDINKPIIYHLIDAAGWPPVPETWANRPTALWLQIQQNPDADVDGIPDSWEQQHFGGATNADPNAFCSNGINTVREAYIAGLDPNDSQSRLLISDFRSLTTGKILGWDAVSGRVYSVYWATNLLTGFQCLESNIPWTRGSFTNATSVPQGFYKIDVQLGEPPVDPPVDPPPVDPPPVDPPATPV